MTDKLILLGTAGGSAIYVYPGTNRSRHGISSAMVVGGRLYIIDQGESSVRQLTLADPLGVGSGNVLRDIEAFFITHLHADHAMDLPNFLHCGYNQGWPDFSVPVIGPWPRWFRQDQFGPEVPEEGIRAPGAADFVSRIIDAAAADLLDRVYASKQTSGEERLHGVDIAVPPELVDADAYTECRPFLAYEDDRIRVMATLTKHGAMFPSLAYRFETETASVVFSGDTGPNKNVIELAQGADILVHEAIDRTFALDRYGKPPYTPEQQAFVDFVLSKHTTADLVGGIAQEAGVRKVILSHLVPANAPDEHWWEGRDDFDGEYIVGEDLDVFEL